MEEYKYHNGKLLRRGLTTGSCAAAAAKAATFLLYNPSLENFQTINLSLPKAEKRKVSVCEITRGENWVEAAVRKDAGDDPDVTDKLLIYAKVMLRGPEGEIYIDGGEGVGRVTLPGLDQPVGEAAINSAPRAMIKQAVQEVREALGESAGIEIIISAPGGEEIAKKTFNPRLGIVGGISILGTTGIVDPMSHEAIRDTIKVELRQLAALGTKTLILTPGNYGTDYIKQSLALPSDKIISCSNFIGESIDNAIVSGFERILLVGHVGKLVKLSMGLPNTHSANGDGRIEALLYAAVKAGAETEVLRKIADTVMTDAALKILQDNGLLYEAMTIVGERIEDFLQRRVADKAEIAYVCFSKSEELKSAQLCASPEIENVLEAWF